MATKSNVLPGGEAGLGLLDQARPRSDQKKSPDMGLRRTMTHGSEATSSSISLVINTYQQAHFLSAAIESGLAQKQKFDQIIVVDDGSTDDPAAVVAGYPGVQLIRQPNAGLAAARNAGLRACTSRYIVFLDADDLLTEDAVADGLACHASHPDAGFIYGAYRFIGPNKEPIGTVTYNEIGEDSYRTLLMFNIIGMHGAVVYDRSKLDEVGGFDPRVRLCEDYDAYLRMARRFPVYSCNSLFALYRWHGQNMSSRHATMLKWALCINERQRVYTGSDSGLEADRRAGRRAWVKHYVNQVKKDLFNGLTSRQSPIAAAKVAWANAPILSMAAREFGQWLSTP